MFSSCLFSSFFFIYLFTYECLIQLMNASCHFSFYSCESGSLCRILFKMYNKKPFLDLGMWRTLHKGTETEGYTCLNAKMMLILTVKIVS